MPGEPELQFERAEFEAPAPGAVLCSACKSRIVDLYYSIGERVVCGACRDAVAALHGPAGRLGRVLGALLLGGIAALSGSTLYTLVSVLTGYEFSLVSIAVGFLIGAGVRRGCRRRGGWGYQLLAALFTYASIGGSYALYSLIEYREQAAESQPAATSPAPDSADPAAGAAEHAAGSAHAGVGETVGRLTLALMQFVVFLAAISLALPVLVGMDSPLTFVIVGFAVWQAWLMNRRVTVELHGPFAVGKSP